VYGSEPELGPTVHELQLRGDAQLRGRVGQLRLDDALADEQLLSDLSRGAALRSNGGDLVLTGAQRARAEERGLRQLVVST
jgi:hypothetical protein